MAALKLASIGTSIGIVFPEEMLARLKATSGDNLFLVEIPSGYLLTSYEPVVEEEVSSVSSSCESIARRSMLSSNERS